MIEKIKPVFGPTNRKNSLNEIQRFGAVIGLKYEFEQNIQNYMPMFGLRFSEELNSRT